MNYDNFKKYRDASDVKELTTRATIEAIIALLFTVPSIAFLGWLYWIAIGDGWTLIPFMGLFIALLMLISATDTASLISKKTMYQRWIDGPMYEFKVVRIDRATGKELPYEIGCDTEHHRAVGNSHGMVVNACDEFVDVVLQWQNDAFNCAYNRGCKENSEYLDPKMMKVNMIFNEKQKV